jgi:hypothetical protein
MASQIRILGHLPVLDYHGPFAHRTRSLCVPREVDVLPQVEHQRKQKPAEQLSAREDSISLSSRTDCMFHQDGSINGPFTWAGYHPLRLETDRSVPREL